jgi:hypothetical protein
VRAARGEDLPFDAPSFDTVIWHTRSLTPIS